MHDEKTHAGKPAWVFFNNELFSAETMFISLMRVQPRSIEKAVRY